MLCGLLTPTHGKGHVLGRDVMRELEAVKPHVGYMSQKFSLYPDLSVKENLDFFGGIYRVPSERLRERIAWAIEMAGLVGMEQALTRDLAGGYKQRLALGAALLHSPQLLFLDEPTAGVAPKARRGFWELIHSLAVSGTTIFVTSHYMDEVEQCDRIALMSRGKIVALDTPAALKSDPRVRREGDAEPTLEDVFVSMLGGGGV
jgi:ABC-2 type transport system ATP-binding protein